MIGDPLQYKSRWRGTLVPRLSLSLQGSNIPDDYTAPTAFNNSPIRAHSNEIDRYYNYSFNVGGPVVRDRVWWFGTYNRQFNAVSQPRIPAAGCGRGVERSR